jgi:aspartyl-tRNA(Asn)/glutamyl-tRNA(Gln) amidotransferase subunit A
MENLTLKKAIELIKAGHITSSELTLFYLGLIEKRDKYLKSLITLNKNAKDTSREKDRASVKEGRLFGIPFIIKDNFLTKGLRTTAASKVLDKYIPQYNATVVQRLLDAGGILLGKANMDAWAHGSSTETSDYGASRNPWDIKRLPGGSSGGSASAVEGDLCSFAVGSETAGSIRHPSSWCGNVGLKPTYGRVSRYGLIAMGSSLDCPGPMTKTVEDAALVLDVLAGRDEKDATTSSKPIPEYTDFLNKSIKGLRVGIAKQYLFGNMRSDVKKLIVDAGKVFESLGARVEYVNVMDTKYALGVYTIVMRSEVSSNLARFDGIRYGNNRTFFAEEAKRRMMIGAFSLSSGYADKYYKKAQEVRAMYIEDFENVFKKYDILIGPTSVGPAQKLGATENDPLFGEMEDILVEPSSISGLPGISIPCGFVEGLPVGLNIMGPHFSEGILLQAADAYEKSTDWHNKKPKFKYVE